MKHDKVNDKQSKEISRALYNMLDLIEIIHDYCEHNIDHEKISPILTMIEKIEEEGKIVSDAI